MPIPSAESQLQFLKDVQALLEDGQFAATYKFALLIALADISVESGVDDDRPLPVPLTAIAVKFVEYYWQQSVPFAGAAASEILRQNAGQQAAVIRLLAAQRLAGFDSLPKLRSDARAWAETQNSVAQIVRVMPLYRLQVVAGTLRPFLYPHEIEGGAITLNPGVAHHLRRFHPLVTGLARNRWIATIRRIPANLYAVGQAQDLEVFLFGSAREPTRRYLEPLLDLQHGRCLYCRESLRPAAAHVDHFVPWVLHRCDAVSNLVAAHDHCNLAKKDLLAAEQHVEHWVMRNDEASRAVWSSLLQPIDPAWATVGRVARWAYDRAFDLGALTWVREREMQQLSERYRGLLPA